MGRGGPAFRTRERRLIRRSNRGWAWWLAVAVAAFSWADSSNGWTDHRSFEEGRVGTRASGKTGLGEQGAFPGTVLSERYVYSGKLAACATIERASRGLGKWGGVWTFPEVLDESETIWLLFHIYLPEGFDAKAQGRGLRLVRLVTLTAGGKEEGSIEVSLDPQTRRLNIHNSLAGVRFPMAPRARRCGEPVPLGEWQAIELQVTLASQRGRGVVRLWQDERLVFQDTKRPTLGGPFSRVRYAWLLSEWPGGAPKRQSVWLDDLVATNETPSQRDRRGNVRLWPYASRPEAPSPRESDAGSAK